MDDVLASIVLQPRLLSLIQAPFTRAGGGLVLEPLVKHATGPASFQDRTGYEAFINKIHVDDLVDYRSSGERENLCQLIRQGVKAAVVLSERLEKEGKYRVLLSLDADLPTMSLRFFERRDGEPWGSEDPDEFPLEEVLMIDTRSCG